MALMAVLESDLRALSAEARRRYPAVKDAAEHAILKLRSLSGPGEIADNEDIVRIFLMACDAKSVKLSVLGLACLQKLISHDAVASSALKDILSTLKDHSEMADDSVQLKTLQTILLIFQSRLHPDNEDNMAQALGICLRLLENSRSSDSVRNTAAATFRQAVALIFDNVNHAEWLPAGKYGSQLSRANSVTNSVTHSISESDFVRWLETRNIAVQPNKRDFLSKTGKLGLFLLEDLTALAAGGSAMWLRVHSLQRIFALDILEFVLSHYVAIFQTLLSYEQQVLRHQICSLLMTSLRTNVEREGESEEPTFRRLVLRSVAHIIKLYSTSLVTESEVFLNMLVKVACLDLPLWHQILVLEVLRQGFCVEVQTLRLLFKNFDMDPKNTNVVENIVKALARVVSTIQLVYVVPESSEESLAAVAGMFNSKAKGVEWSMDNDASNAAVVVASEAHAITLAVEGLLGVVFAVATLTDEAADVGEIDSPKNNIGMPSKFTGETVVLCLSLIDSTWLTILDALSLILTRSQGEAVIIEVLKGYQAFTQACGVLHVIEPLNSFLASLCKFTINIPTEGEKKSVVLSPGSKKAESLADQRDIVVLTPKNVQALRTLFNVAHRLHDVLGPSWVLVLETLAALDRVIHSPHASTQEVSVSVSRLPRETSGQYSDFNILSSLNSQLFESSALMHVSAVNSILSALRQLSIQCISGYPSGMGQALNQQIGSVAFCVESITSVLVNNLHRVHHIWDGVVGHLLELFKNQNQQIRNLALDALDQSICAVLGSDQFQSSKASELELTATEVNNSVDKDRPFEHEALSPLITLYNSSQGLDVQAGALKILLHVLERYADKLQFCWSGILDMLRSVADASERDLIPLGFQNIRVIMNDALSTIPVQCLDVCIEVTGAYAAQKTEINISLTAIGLLWTATDFIAKGLSPASSEETTNKIVNDKSEADKISRHTGTFSTSENEQIESISNSFHNPRHSLKGFDRNKLLFSVFSILQKLGSDERPEVRNSAVRTLFQTLGIHGQKISESMWNYCLWTYVLPLLECVSHLAATSSSDEWQGKGKELGTRRGKTVHMLIHHSRDTAQKQWDETLVLVLGGITRLLRSFFPFLQSLNKFSAGWELLLRFIEDSILNGSKEVAVAAISCLQTVVSSHCSKGNLALPYIKSILDVYELALERSPDCRTNSAVKVKQEILHGLGDLYVQAKSMFDTDMYLKLLLTIHLAIKCSMIPRDADSEVGILSPIQRTILEILPLLRPPEHLSAEWFALLQLLLCYLLGSEVSMHQKKDEEPNTGISSRRGSAAMGSFTFAGVSNTETTKETWIKSSSNVFGGSEPPSIPTSEATPDETSVCNWNHLFMEKLIPVIIELFLAAPSTEKCNIFPKIIKGLGRCMNTRRDSPKGSLWRLAVESFNRIINGDLMEADNNIKLDSHIYRHSRARLWKEVADVYDLFLVGSCGRALSSNGAAESLEADEVIEMNVLNVLADMILKGQIDAPVEILHRLVSTLDRCASRTGSLPLESLGQMPSHCSRFSLSCLQMMFSLCSFRFEDDWPPERATISSVSIDILMKRCEIILQQFLSDENDLGENALPAVRTNETFCVLQELARMVIHSDTASVLNIPAHLKEKIENSEIRSCHAHLLVLFPSICELVVSRESRIRELVQVLLRLVAEELGLQKSTHADS
ncbi:protein MON2 homolog isoform X4 [Phalaenopsis equestris]|uniref:protein MON2 homolog isoform X4 n=1 Tax=Phalaenopsis equestris TaxID=78828 RepID=UPI0009E47F5A|nr:protein MON2 homolog isoform X4 [Phalaenopsis equestris]